MTLPKFRQLSYRDGNLVFIKNDGTSVIINTDDEPPPYMTAADLSAAIADLAYVTADELSNALTNVATMPGDDGAAGPAGAESVLYGTDLSTDPAISGWVSDPLVVGDNYTLLSANAWLRGGVGSDNTVIDLEADVGAGYASVFTTSPDTRLIIPAGQVLSGKKIPAISSLPLGTALRAKILSAPSGGGSLSWGNAAVAGDGATGGVSSLNIPIPSGDAAGNLLLTAIFTNATSVSWPSGWTQVSAPVPFGSSVGPMWMYIATKISNGSESSTQAVTLTSSVAVMASATLPGGTLGTSMGATVNDGTTTTSAPIATGLSTVAANSIVVHIIGTRTTSGGVPGTYSWSNSLPNNGQAVTARTGANTNLGIGITHETQAVAGALAARTVSWTNTSRYVLATLIISPSGGATAKGPMVRVRMTPAA